MIRILLVDDRNIMRQGLKALLEPRPNLKVVGFAEDGNSAIEQVKILQPDIVLMDIEMPGINGIIATHKICQQFPTTKIIVLSSHENTEYVTKALKAGAKGYLLKNSSIEDLEQTICSVHQGHSQIESKLRTEILAQSSNLNVSSKPNRSVSKGKRTLRKTSFKLDSNVDNPFDNKEKIGKTTQPAKMRSPYKIDAVNNSTALKEDDVEQSSALSTDLTENKPALQPKKSTFPKYWWLIIGLGIFSILSIAITIFVYWRASKTSPQPVVETPVVPQAVAAIGYLEPQGEVIELSAPAFLEGARVEELLVKRGDWVKAGQVVAVLDNRDRLQAALQQAQTEVKTAQARLAQVQAGAKKGEIQAQNAKFQETKAELTGQIATQSANIANLEAQLEGQSNSQQATIARLEAELNNATKECQRYEFLLADGAIATSERDRICLQQDIIQQQLQAAKVDLTEIKATLQQKIGEAKANLERTKTTSANQISEAEASLEAIAEVRPVDVAVARSELANAEAAVIKAQADLDLASVKSPRNGQILEINTRSGEIVDNAKGIVVMGDTQNMYVVAEVYETDIDRVRIGQSAIVTSDGVTQELTGTVDNIGLRIGTKDVLGTDPVADTDARVVEVRIRLNPESSKRVANLTNLEVNAIIHTSQQVGKERLN